MRTMIVLFILFSASLFSQNVMESLLATRSRPKSDREARCISPQAAMSATLDGLQDRTACFEQKNYSSSELLIVRNNLISVLKSNNVDVNSRTFPEDPNYLNDKSKEHRFIVLDVEPPIYLERVRGEWIFNEQVIKNINALYKSSLYFRLDWFYNLLPAWCMRDLFGIEGFNCAQFFLVAACGLFAFLLRYVMAAFIAWQFNKFLLARIKTQSNKTLLRKIAATIANLLIAVLLSFMIAGLDVNVHFLHYTLTRFFSCVRLQVSASSWPHITQSIW